MTGTVFENWVESTCKVAKELWGDAVLTWHLDNASTHKAGARLFFSVSVVSHWSMVASKDAVGQGEGLVRAAGL